MADVDLIPGTGPRLQNDAESSIGGVNVPTPTSDSFLTSRGTPIGNEDGDSPNYSFNASAPLSVDPGDAGN